MSSGRFAPSPTGRLHLGNLRTALLAWLFARSTGSPLHLRFDDLDTGSVRDEHYDTQRDDLTALGLDWDGDPIRQRDRLDRYRHALDRLRALDVLYPCYCSRREIREAAQAPNRPLAGHGYPGTCRRLDATGRAARDASGRRPAWRLRTEAASYHLVDRLRGEVSVELDDFVVERNDGTPAYHLVTVVDDDALAVELVVRGDDLLDSTGRQLLVADLLGLRRAEHAHVPLVLSPDGERLAKRHGAVTLPDRMARGESPLDVLRFLAASLDLPGAAEATGPADLLPGFDPDRLPTEPLVLPVDDLT
ncbi:MAG: tRNA glutamyl-Q(34) synthetase GluQRS [Actinomycetota bacterium]